MTKSKQGKFWKKVKSENPTFILTKSELKQLLFWAHVGTTYSISGSYAQTIPKIIVKYMKLSKLKPRHFTAGFENPERNKIAFDVLHEWYTQNTKVTGGTPT